MNHIHPAISGAPLALPLFATAVQAGFPSPADDHIERALDLNELLIVNPPATFYVRATGDSMEGVGIFDGDILVVDRSVEGRNGSVVIAALDGDLVVKTLWIGRGGLGELRAASPKYTPIQLGPEQDFAIWGVVTAVVHRL